MGRRLLLALVVVFAVGCTQTTAPNAAEGTSPPVSVTTTTPPPPTSPPSPEVKVPKVEGTAAADAKKLLNGAGFLVQIETKYTDASPAGTVLSQSPKASTTATVGVTVRLVVAEALPLIPDVVGLKLTQARQTLKNKGFDVQVKMQVSSQPKDTVISQSPVGGTSARPGRNVTITVAKPPPPPPPNNCTPGYSPCLPLGPSDYDCAGGSGDGPAYTEPGVTYRVTGSDPYGLDADNDGYGCE